jgi:predicted enzyme related to lactoylglutathione lyase
MTMPARTEYAPGTPSWTDLATPDLAASRQFYGELFGWEFTDEDTGDPDNPYVMGRQGGKDVAGVMKLTADMQAGGMPPVWSTYVTVKDVEASARQAKDLGGAVLSEPMDVMDAGRMAVLADPAGAVFCIWEPKESIGAQIVNEPFSLTWNELMSTDLEQVKPFYTGLFGWKPETMDMGGDGPPYTVWMLGEGGIGGGMPSAMPGMPSFWSVYFAVDDCDAIVEKAKKLGATVMNGPMDVPEVGRMAALTDPQGAVFNVIKNAAPTS